MRKISQFKLALLRLVNSKSGAVATEYAFLIAFIAIVAATGMTLLGQNLSVFFNDIGVALATMSGNLPCPFDCAS
jgi:Flp pilus assembly pilin Flp